MCFLRFAHRNAFGARRGFSATLAFNRRVFGAKSTEHRPENSSVPFFSNLLLAAVQQLRSFHRCQCGVAASEIRVSTRHARVREPHKKRNWTGKVVEGRMIR